MLLFLKSGTQQINMPAVYSSRKLNLNSQPEAEGNKIHASKAFASSKKLTFVKLKSDDH